MALSRPCPGRTASDALTHLGLGYHLANIFGYNSGPHMGHSKSAGGLLGGGGCATGGGAGELGGGGAGRGGGSHGGAKPVSRVALASPFAGPAGAAALRDVQSMPPNAAAAVRAAEAAVNSAAAAAASQQGMLFCRAAP